MRYNGRMTQFLIGCILVAMIGALVNPLIWILCVVAVALLVVFVELLRGD